MAASIVYNLAPPSDAYYGYLGSVAQANAAVEAAKAAAQGNAQSGMYQGMGQAIGANQQGLAGLGNAYSANYGSLAGGLGNVANAMSNEMSNRYGSYAMAEAARQAAAGNIGSSALGAYGSGLNSALGAWGTNQASYNQALSSMQNANQMGMSQYGQSRNNALAQLAAPYAQLGRASMAGSALSQLGGMFGGQGSSGSFSANSPGGPVAAGSYSQAPSGGSRHVAQGGKSEPMSNAYAGLSGISANLMSPDVMDRMGYGNRQAMDSLNNAYYSSRGMPSQMLSQGYGAISNLARQGYDQLGNGMNQYYANMNDPNNRVNYSGVLGQLHQGFQSANDNIGTLPGWMDRGLSKFPGMRV